MARSKRAFDVLVGLASYVLTTRTLSSNAVLVHDDFRAAMLHMNGYGSDVELVEFDTYVGWSAGRLIEEAFEALYKGNDRRHRGYASLVLMSSPEPLEPSDGAPVADCHLHSGASISPSALISWFMQSSPDPDLRRVLTYEDADGTDAQVLFAYRCCLRLAIYGKFVVARLAGLPPQELPGKASFQRSAFWSEFDPYPSRADLIQDVLEWSAVLMPQVHDVSPMAVCRWTMDHVGQDELYGLMFCVGLIGRATAIDYGSGLAEFVRAFDRASALRDLLAGNNRYYLTIAVEHLCKINSFECLELRKSLARPRGDADVIHTLDAHINALGTVPLPRRPVRFGVPLTWVRRLDRRDIPGVVTPADYFDSTWSIGRDIVIACDVRPDLTDVIHGFDVVGDESLTEDWSYFVTMQAVRRAVEFDFVRSFHAGEKLTAPYEALRRVGELVYSGGGVERIGHGLVLGLSLSDFASGVFYDACTTRDALYALTLAWRAGVGVDDASALIASLLEAVGLVHRFDSSQDFCEVASRRFDIDALVAGGALADSDIRSGISTPATLVAEEARQRSPLLLFTHRGGGEFGYLDSPLPFDLRPKVERFFEDTFEPVRDAVIDRVVDSGITIEVCPTSNSVIGRRDLSILPGWRLAQRGVVVTVNTDDPLLFSSEISKEYGWARMFGGLDSARLIEHALQHGARALSNEFV